MARKADVLIYVEDPGAANYVAELPVALAARGWQTTLLADGSAMDYLHQQGIPAEAVVQPAAADRILASHSPRLLIVGSSENTDSLGLTLVGEARSAHIVTVGVVDAQPNADYRFRGRSDSALTYAPEWLLVPDQWTKEAYVALGYPDERVKICGHPRYDHVREVATRLDRGDRSAMRQALFPGAGDDRSVVVFAAERSTGLNPQAYQRSAEYTLTGRGASTGRTEIVLEEFLDAIQAVKPLPYLVLRLHPKNVPDEFGAYLDEFDLVSQGGSPLELIYAADLVVGLTSMMLLEAALLGRPTLSIAPRAVEKMWLPTIGAQLTMCASSRGDVRAKLLEAIHGHTTFDSQALARLIPNDSFQRVVRFIEQLCPKWEVDS